MKKRSEQYYMSAVKLGPKGQIVIPKEAREVFDIHPGDHLLVLADARQGLAIPPKGAFDEYFKKIFG